MTAQLEFPLSERAPKVTPEEIALFCEALRAASREFPGRKGWHTSDELGAKTAQQKRHLRAMSEASDGRVVSYPGSPGYKLFDECVPEDFLHGDRATRSAIRKQLAKWTAVLRRMHARGVVFPADYAADPIE